AYVKSLPRIRSELVVPIKIGNKVLGVLNIESRQLNAFDKQDLELLEILAAHAAVAINGLKEKENAKRKSKQLTALMKATTEIVSAKDLRSRLKVIAKAINSLGWRRVVISVRDENLEIVDLVTVGLTREERKLLWERRAPGHVWRERLGPKFHRYKMGEFFYLPWNDPWVREHVHGIPPEVPPDKANFVAGVPSRLSPDEMIDWHPQDMLYAPLRTPDGKIVGILSVDDPIDGRKPTLESLSPLEIFLRIAAVAIENAKLIEELEKARKELKEYAEQLELKVQERTRELKESQEKLLKAERLAAIGQLAGQVGHDLRNPLTGILGAAYYLKRTLTNLDEKCRKMLEIIEKDAKYANKIIEDLLEFSREYVHLNPITTSIRYLVDNALTKVTVPDNVKIMNLTSFKHKVEVDADRMIRVFVNLITNAIDAMPNGGVLRIWSHISDKHVKVFFKDTGIGISKENLDKIWGPLFTTKAKGMGLGLSICKRIVEAHGGSIKVKSKVGAGTTFTVILPLKPKIKEIGGEKVWVNLPESLLSTTTKA
ncbi:MAG TPA: GAF domain-containing protein, partial [Candidatus Bathyarchaeota archaeon]|nr:GAF domain-containing protein [Candidatus Bathyarchaeota archaeon]